VAQFSPGADTPPADPKGVNRVRDGLIASERVYLDREEALEAAGLRE
jgi:hypothetical protein